MAVRGNQVLMWDRPTRGESDGCFMRALDVPALVLRSGESDANHTRTTSEQVAGMLPDAQLAEPPWGDREWLERSAAGTAHRG